MEEQPATRGEDETLRLAVGEQHLARRETVGDFCGFAARDVDIASELARAEERAAEARREAERRSE